ncbi:polysaccharide deacetylase family protein [Bacteroides heparinolyticus]|uniref:polysaccharide deacetylase family protein n=1 Tax=Prevotella heparinolytica TaxID=28113 RepID=UPI003F9FDDB2
MNILSFDIEEWYLEKILHGGRSYKYKQFDETLIRVLDNLERLGIKATFFCVGKLAEEYPQVVRDIAARGHEIGCHSNEHTWLNKMTESQLKNDTVNAIKSLENITGQRVVSYRAPAFSITQENKWAIDVLAECGIENDASIFPTSRDYGGFKGFPQNTPCIIRYNGLTLKEYPISLTTLFGKKIAYSGGGYFRLLPYWFASKTVNDNNYNICYFHLADLISEKKRMMTKSEYEEYFKEPGTFKNRIMRYAKSNVGTGDAYQKLLKLLSDYRFSSIRDCDFNWKDAKIIEL